VSGKIVALVVEEISAMRNVSAASTNQHGVSFLFYVLVLAVQRIQQARSSRRQQGT
jgi:hypothetical protein